MAERGFVLDPPAEEALLGKVAWRGLRSRWAYGFWWLSKRPRAVYVFAPEALRGVTAAVLEWIGAERYLLVPDYITTWPRLIDTKYNRDIATRRPLLDALRAYRMTKPRFERLRERVKEHLFLDRDPRLMGATTLDGWSAQELARLAGEYTWGLITAEGRGGSLDAYLLPDDGRRALRIQHEGSLWLYSSDEADLEAFAEICTRTAYNGLPVDNDRIGDGRIKGPDSRLYAWVNTWPWGTLSCRFQDTDRRGIEERRGIVIDVTAGSGRLTITLGNEQDDPHSVVACFDRASAARIATLLRAAAEARSGGQTMVAVAVKGVDPQQSAAVAVFGDKVSLSLSSDIIGNEARFDADFADEIAAEIEKVLASPQ